MRYHYFYAEKDEALCGKIYHCDHPLYSECTLYIIGNRGLAIIQQRYDYDLKISWWGKIDKCLVNDIYYNKGFYDIFNKNATAPVDGLYPTWSVRQIMWALRMKPLKRYFWETSFDHKPI